MTHHYSKLRRSSKRIRSSKLLECRLLIESVIAYHHNSERVQSRSPAHHRGFSNAGFGQKMHKDGAQRAPVPPALSGMLRTIKIFG